MENPPGQSQPINMGHRLVDQGYKIRGDGAGGRNEFQARSMLSAGHTLDYGNTYVVPVARALRLFACA